MWAQLKFVELEISSSTLQMHIQSTFVMMNVDGWIIHEGFEVDS